MNPLIQPAFARYLPWGVLAIALVATFLLWQIEYRNSLQALQIKFDFRAQDAHNKIEQRMLTYQQMLRGVQGLYSASKTVTRQEFNAYVNSLKIEKNFPGIQSIGYVLMVTSAQKASHIAAIRREGFPDYTIKPAGERDLYAVVTYIEPFSGHNLRAFGYDYLQDPLRREIIEYTRDTGEPALTEKVKLIQEETEQRIQAGVIMVLPIYKNGGALDMLEQRRANHMGLVSSSFRMNNLMDGIMGVGSADVDITIYSGASVSNEMLMYDGNGYHAIGKKEVGVRYESISQIKILGRTWTIMTRSMPAFDAQLDERSPAVVAYAGIGISVLLALLTLLLVQGQTVARLAAQQSSASKLRLDAIMESAGDGIITMDEDGIIESFNPAAERIFGYSGQEIVGKPANMLLPQSKRNKNDGMLTHFLTTGEKKISWGAREVVAMHKDRSIFPLELTSSEVRNNAIHRRSFIAVVRDITQRKQAEQEIQSLAYYDALTGLPNRILLQERIKQLIAESHRDKHKFALLFLDLDRFKYVNDAMGHAVGDLLLQAVAARLRECVREGDTVSRMGGDEFVVLLREIEKPDIIQVAEKILQTIAQPFDINNMSIGTKVSIGISIYPDTAIDISSLFKQSDIAMYQAKAEGGGDFQFFTEDMNFHSDRLFSMERDLRLAIERQQFVLHYQPQFHLASGRICGVEVLLRWQHPQKGLLLPAEFLPVAEETSQIVSIGAWVLRAACEQLVGWRAQGMATFPIAINFSIQQLRQPNLAQLIIDTLHETGLLPSDLELEITEGSMIGDTVLVMAFLDKMYALGVRLSIDDFGTGYSSLNYLKKMPLTRLKIDQTFIRDIVDDENDAIIVDSIISLGHKFGLEVIAEGVETVEQMDFLRQRYCDEIQGYYFSYPLPADELVQFVNKHNKSQSI